MAIGGVNVIDDPTLAGYRGSFKYDSEGTPTSKRDIIKDGKLVGQSTGTNIDKIKGILNEITAD